MAVPREPAEHPANGAIVVATAANMLGLNNAATPFSIKAMEELQELNPRKDTASNAMVTFMALTTSGVQLIPATMIGVLVAAGSKNPTAIISHVADRHRHRHRRGRDRGEGPAAVLSDAY